MTTAEKKQKHSIECRICQTDFTACEHVKEEVVRLVAEGRKNTHLELDNARLKMAVEALVHAITAQKNWIVDPLFRRAVEEGRLASQPAVMSHQSAEMGAGGPPSVQRARNGASNGK